MNVLEILNQLNATTSRLEKESILKREIGNTVLRDCFEMALNPYLNYWIKKRTPAIEHYGVQSLQDALAGIRSKIITREYTGNLARDYVAQLTELVSADDAEVMWRVIERDLRCGVQVATANKIWKGLIPEFKVMLASNDLENIQYPAYAQLKLDGARVHLTLKNGEVLAFSRAGKPVELHGCLDGIAEILFRDGETWDGELLAAKDGKFLPRKIGNGIVTKAIRGTISEKEAQSLVFVTWDIIHSPMWGQNEVEFPINGARMPYRTRLAVLESRFDGIEPRTGKIWCLETQVVESDSDVSEVFVAALKSGEEGIVVKNQDSRWEGKRSKNLVKIKDVLVADLQVVGWKEGTGKNKGLLGALTCESYEGKIQVDVGIGFKDHERKSFTPESLIGKIVAVQYNAKIKSATDKVESLYLPRFISVRDDKTTPNSYEEIK